jgi:hypothetical protein
MQEKAQQEQKQLQQLLWIGAVLIWCWRAYQGLLLHQLYEAPFIFVGADNTFWLYHALQIPQTIISHYYLALLLDMAWLGMALYGAYKVPKIWAGLIFCCLYTNYFIIYNSVATHHEHILVAGLFCFLLLCIHSLSRFVWCFVALRYYALWVLFSAALWKIALGSWNDPLHLDHILKQQHLSILLLEPNDWYSQCIYWLLEHPQYSAYLWYVGWMVELSFGIGFFTRQWDKYLAVLWLLFFVMDYWLMGLCFAEFCIFVLLFYPWRAIWEQYQQQVGTSKGKAVKF